MSESKHLRVFFIILYSALGGVALWLVFKYVLGWIMPFIIAFFVSRIISVPVNCAEKRLRFPRPLASVLLTLLFYGLLILLVYWGGSQLISESGALLEYLQSLKLEPAITAIDGIWESIVKSLPKDIQEFINNNIGTWTSGFGATINKLITPIAGFAASFASKLPSILIAVTVTVVATYFFSCDFDVIRKRLAALVPGKWRQRISQTQRHISQTLICYVKAFFLLLLITFIELSVGLMLLRIRHPILIAFTITFVDALPILGTGCVLIPWAIFALFSQNIPLAIGLILLYVIIVVVRNAIEPKIIGKQIGLHPLATLVAMYIGLKAFGLIGMLMPIPVALATQFYRWGYFDFHGFKKEGGR